MAGTGITATFGRPGIGTALSAVRRNVSRNGALDFYPAGGTIKGTKARDPGNSDTTLNLRPGLVMGKITSGGYWANSILGLTNGALTGTGTTLTVAAAVVTELVRRVGASGTFKLTGPPTAAGTVRTLTVTYSAASGTSITITALNVNEVQRINFNIAATGGNVVLKVPHPSGDMITTTTAAWNATDATFLSNINTVLDVATGVSGGIVASAISAVDTDLGFLLTYSGTGYAGLPQPMAEVVTLPTSSTTWNAIRTVTGVDGRFVTLSVVQPTDGSETPLSIIPDGYGLVIPDDSSDIDFAMIPVAGTLDTTQIIDYPSDASLKTWLKNSLSTLAGGKWIFSDVF